MSPSLQESDVIDRLKNALHQLWAPSRHTIPLNQGQLVQARLTDGAFTVKDASAVSPSPPSLDAAPRVGIVSPETPGGLSPVDLPFVDDHGVVRASSEAAARRSKKQSADDDAAVPGESILGANSGDGISSREARSARKSDWRRGDVETWVKHSALSGDDLEPSSTDGRPTKRLATTEIRRVEGDREDVVIGDESTMTVSGAHTERMRQKAGQQRKETAQREAKAPLARNTNDPPRGARAANGEPRTDAAVRNWADETNVSSTEVHDETGTRGVGNLAVSGPLAFDLSRILMGCRKASSMKRKRDARNAKAYSFSAKLSGRASADDQDSKAAARAFSRVLHKVGNFLRAVRDCLPPTLLFAPGRRCVIDRT